MPTSLTVGLLARVTHPAQASEVKVALPTIALTKAPLPPPAANDRLGAVIDIAPVVATTAAGPPAPPIKVIGPLATIVTAAPCTVAPVMAMLAGSRSSRPVLVRLALMAMVPAAFSLRSSVWLTGALTLMLPLRASITR